ncbi:preprotein translocase subunit SecE [Thermomonas sp.]|uniref:preprotein translocase subunit SecE n=1 Tax=Thermomonas sp. TaxID=1971895 RepID=UPI001DDFEE3F|nr:preprotein translocase subunit SecE [Thermomonas sp.]MBZ0087462.1 preprotein translocase subunit SecE [Thermomonas sp.]MCO5054523.1 preprotein translocase subunit SecE [Thermomonas sp.]HRO64494.1 preprotein translocase subunit SecE [Thermomonas sp.]
MTSNALPNPSAGSGDIVKYVIAIVLVAAGITAYYLIGSAWPSGVRMLLVAAGVIAGGALFLMSTSRGAKTRGFLAESRFELRKVVWPTRQETNRMMMVVILAVLAFSLIMAAFDFIIQFAVKWLLGS